MAFKLGEAIRDQTKNEGMTPRALEILQAAAKAAEAAGLASLDVVAAKGGGHKSHGAGTEWDLVGKNADGSLWTNDQRAQVAQGGRTGGADRFGLYEMDRGLGHGTLHIGYSHGGFQPAVWGAGGQTSGSGSRQFNNAADRTFLRDFESGKPFTRATRDIAAGPAPGGGRATQNVASRLPDNWPRGGPTASGFNAGIFDRVADRVLRFGNPQALGAPPQRNVVQELFDRVGRGRAGVRSDAVPPSTQQRQATLRQGMEGPQVKALQQDLIRAGLLEPKGADGKFGPQTAAAVRQLEQIKGLPTQDRGIAGREVFGALRGGGMPPPVPQTTSTQRAAPAATPATTSRTAPITPVERGPALNPTAIPQPSPAPSPTNIPPDMALRMAEDRAGGSRFVAPTPGPAATPPPQAQQAAAAAALPMGGPGAGVRTSPDIGPMGERMVAPPSAAAMNAPPSGAIAAPAMPAPVPLQDRLAQAAGASAIPQALDEKALMQAAAQAGAARTRGGDMGPVVGNPAQFPTPTLPPQFGAQPATPPMPAAAPAAGLQVGNQTFRSPQEQLAGGRSANTADVQRTIAGGNIPAALAEQGLMRAAANAPQGGIPQTMVPSPPGAGMLGSQEARPSIRPDALGPPGGAANYAPRDIGALARSIESPMFNPPQSTPQFPAAGWGNIPSVQPSPPPPSSPPATGRPDQNALLSGLLSMGVDAPNLPGVLSNMPGSVQFNPAEAQADAERQKDELFQQMDREDALKEGGGQSSYFRDLGGGAFSGGASDNLLAGGIPTIQAPSLDNVVQPQIADQGGQGLLGGQGLGDQTPIEGPAAGKTDAQGVLDAISEISIGSGAQDQQPGGDQGATASATSGDNTSAFTPAQLTEQQGILAMLEEMFGGGTGR